MSRLIATIIDLKNEVSRCCQHMYNWLKDHRFDCIRCEWRSRKLDVLYRCNPLMDIYWIPDLDDSSDGESGAVMCDMFIC